MNRAVIVLLCCLGVFVSCTKEDAGQSLQPTPDSHQVTVAVVAPLSDTSTKQRLERTAQWFAENLSEAQAGDSVAITLKLEWYDEQAEDIDALGNRLSSRDDVAAVIGPFDNDRMARFASYCQVVRK